MILNPFDVWCPIISLKVALDNHWGIQLDDEYALSNWFHVKFNRDKILLDVNPPPREGWQAEIPWRGIIRVCFKPGDLFESDEIYIFTDKRPESYVIPTEATGGAELWDEIIDRKLFDAGLAIQAMTALEGIFCWPEE